MSASGEWAVVIAAVAGPSAEATLEQAADTALAAAGAGTSPRRRLGERALELYLEGPETLAATIRAALRNRSPAGCDWAVVPRANRRKRLLVCDMDSTVIEQECLDELADYAGLKEEISAITERAMRGELDFERALTERVRRLRGLDLSALEACYRDRISLTPGARALTATMTDNGARCLLVSGGFTFFTSRVAEAAGFHEERANRLLDDGATLTGQVARPILGRDAKRAALEETAASLGLAPRDALAMGDGANDLAMIEAAGLGVAFRAKPVVAAAADAAIDFGDLRSALYFQGYADTEIRT